MMTGADGLVPVSTGLPYKREEAFTAPTKKKAGCKGTPFGGRQRGRTLWAFLLFPLDPRGAKESGAGEVPKQDDERARVNPRNTGCNQSASHLCPASEVVTCPEWHSDRCQPGP